MRRSALLWLLAVTSSASMTALWACGGDDSTTPPAGEDAGNDSTAPVDATGGDVANDTSTAPDVGTDTGARDGAPTDAPLGDAGRTLDGALCGAGDFAVTKVDPIFGWTGANVGITITGSGFIATPKVYLKSASGTLTQLTHAAFVSATSITAIVPKGTAAGTYTIGVVNPNTCAELGPTYNEVANPPPIVDDVSPATGTTQNDTTVTVTGCHFPANATLATVAAGAQPVAQTAGTVTCAPDAGATCSDGTALCTMTGAKIATTTLTEGAYVVRVSNPTDMTYGEWSAFVVSNPSGKLAPPPGGMPNASGLNTGRRSLGVVAGRVNDASRFVYAIGGEDKDGAALKSVEVGPLDRYGQLGAWFTEKAQLTTARSGLAVVRQGSYLYAIGGTSSMNGTGGAAPSGNPLDTIERARILDPSGAPILHDPPVAAAGGTLAKGTWYYKVAAVMAAGDADNPNGESLASDEAVITVDANSQVTLTWDAVTGADHYKVYRSPMADGVSESEVLIKDNVAGTTYADKGDAAGTEKPNALGATTVWQQIAVKLAHPRLNAGATIAPDPSGALHVYVAGGWGSACLLPDAGASGEMDCYELATIDTAGATLGAFAADAAHPFLFARMRHGVAAMTAANGPSNFVATFGQNGAILVQSGGPGLGSVGDSVEYAVVGANGIVGPWSIPTGYGTERDGSQLQIANGYSYAFLGGKLAMYSQTSEISTTPTFPAQDGGGNGLAYGSWSNAGANLSSNVGRHGVALESAYFYVVGGTSDDKDALTSVYQILY